MQKRNYILQDFFKTAIVLQAYTEKHILKYVQNLTPI